MAQGTKTNRRESIVCLEIGMLLRDELLRQGANVVMTREDQTTFHTNIERCEIAEAGGAQIMLRLHCNNSSNRSKRGIQVYGPLNSDYAKAVADADTYREMGQKLLDAIAAAYEVDLIDAVKVPEKDLNRYDRIGFASCIYYSKYHQSVLNFAADNITQNKRTFFISTYGGKADYTSIEKALTAKNSVLLGKYGCKGYDTFGSFKLMGGLAKGHPDEADIAGAVAFYKEITEEK